ncbi:MAG: UDP-N-acetylmuramoyl-tripeptide--D-alanyl-D-alanine ligase, partial [Pyrinomonadaceae bacterium]
DSRGVKKGELFFAFSPVDYAKHGINNSDSYQDAHQYIPQALDNGALAAVARESSVQGNDAFNNYRERLLLVDDVIEGLQQIARGTLEEWGKEIIGITGSAGKTTAKDLTAHLMSATGRRVLKSRKNFNNELGLPLSVLQMETAGSSVSDFDIAVLEMGMSSQFEISRLSRIAPPDIAVELNVLPVHLEYMGNIANIAAAKAQLIEGLKPGGTIVLNADDDLVLAMRNLQSGRVITFGIERPADITAREIDTSRLGQIRFRLITPQGEAPALLRLPGKHNLVNALAASAVANCFDMTAEQIAVALEKAQPTEMRGAIFHFEIGEGKEFMVIDDSYNSNPRSLLSMARTIVNGGSSDQRKFVIAGEMLELGEKSDQLHREAGLNLAQMGIDLLWGVRGLGSEFVKGARAGGMKNGDARFMTDSETTADALVGEVQAGDLVLIKGSRGVRMERIVAALRQHFRLKSEEAEKMN